MLGAHVEMCLGNSAERMLSCCDLFGTSKEGPISTKQIGANRRVVTSLSVLLILMIGRRPGSRIRMLIPASRVQDSRLARKIGGLRRLFPSDFTVATRLHLAEVMVVLEMRNRSRSDTGRRPDALLEN